MKIPVLIPNIFNHPFTYESDINLKEGDYVIVPFGKSKITGVVWDEFEKKNNRNFKIKNVLKKLDVTPLKKTTIKFLNWFAKSSSKKIYSFLRKSIIYVAIIFAVIIAATGKYIFSLPFLLGVLPLIKTKAGITLLQLLRLWGFLRILKNSGRFNFGNPGSGLNSQPISRDEAYKILNLDPHKKYNKEDIQKSYKKIMKKIHPDLNPELNRLAAIVNESKEIVLKDII